MDVKICCPSCGADEIDGFYAVKGVPVHSVMKIRTRADALAFPTGDLDIAFCNACGFIFNRAFDESRLHYSTEYEETQGFSATFNAFHRRLAEDLIARYDLRGKRIVEIGCGKGEFLTMLCELGKNTGVGFDPAYVPARNASPAAHRIRFVQDLYSEKYADVQGDFVCCKMTLEHIADVAAFVGTVRRSLDGQPDAVVFFQIPEVRRILGEGAFWDFYYEHCSYFSPGSLARLFRRQGFDVLNLWTDYDDQYLMIEARPGPAAPPLPQEEAPAVLRREVAAFAAQIEAQRAGWRQALRAMQQENKRVVLWGGGSKAVAFLTTLELSDEVACAVDINPHKAGTFLAGTGHAVVGPEALRADPPDVVVVMNPIYQSEIQRDLGRMELAPQVLPIDAPVLMEDRG